MNIQKRALSLGNRLAPEWVRVALACCLFGLSFTPRAQAGDFTWTNTANGSSANWANALPWGKSPANNYPGRSNPDSVHLTNSITGAYTNIFNASTPKDLVSLDLWNSLGQAWLVVTNATLITGAFTIDNGGRLRIDSGGIFSNTSSTFNWVGTNGIIYLNNSGTLLTAATIGAGRSNVNAFISTTSGTGLGGTWDLNGQNLTIGSGAAIGNVLTISGVTVTNVAAGTVSIGSGGGAPNFGNQLIISNGGAFFGGSVTVGSGGSSNNLYKVGSIGNASTVSNALITVGGTGSGVNQMTVTNANLWSTGLVIGNGSSNNTVTVQDAVTWDFLGSSLKFGAGLNNTLNLTQTGTTVLTNVGGIILGGTATFTLTNASGSPARNIILGMGGSISVGDTAGWGGNTLIISNQSFKTVSASQIGNGSSNNFLTILPSTVWDGSGQALTIGTGVAVNNGLTNSGGSLTNFGAVIVGASAGAVNNGLVITNGGTFTSGAVTLGNAAGARNNYYLIGGVGNVSTVSNGLITVGGIGSSANQLTVTNATLQSAGLTIGNGSSNNTVTVRAGVAWDLQGGALTWGSGLATNNRLLVEASSPLSNVGGLNIGEAGLTVFLTNAGQVAVAQSSQIVPVNFVAAGGGLGVGTNSAVGGVTLTISNYTFTSGATSTIGGGASNNTVNVVTAGVWQAVGAAQGVTIGFGAASNNVLRVSSGGMLSNLNITLGGSAAVSNQLIINGGTVWGNTLWATNAGNGIAFNTGTFNSLNAFVSNNVLTVGTGAQRATFNALSGGTNYFGSGLVIASNATVQGGGAIRGMLTLNGGATIAPGTSPGTINVENLTWVGGGIYSNDLVNFASRPGTGWDYINGAGALTFSPTAENYILRLDSGGTLAANFNPTNDYSLAIAGFVGGISGFDASRFTIDTNPFANSLAGGTFGVALSGTNLYLTFSSIALTPDFVWTNGVSAGWSTASAWTNLSAPPLNGNTALVLKFAGLGSAAYTATNNRTTSGTAGSFTNNKIVFASSSSGTNTLAGATLTFAGTAAGFYQMNGGMFIVSNTLVLAADTSLRGAGLGTVVLASNITGTGQLIRNGAFNSILLGSNSFVGRVWVDATGGTLTLGNRAALGTNSVTVSNGTVLANLNIGGNSYIVGNGWSSQSVLVTGSDAT